ncbi:MAG: DUF1289 domain-containing protein [Methylobacter sp.]|nr:DUF1289 domain-containing protein [Methylobacter sp.]
MKFNPCIDKCTYEGTHCEGCGRTHAEIAVTKKMVMDFVNFAQMQGYENIEEFSISIGKSILKKLQKASQ